MDLEDDVVSGASVTDQPLHGLCCRSRGCAGRVIRRHNEVAQQLMWVLKQVEGMDVRVEEKMTAASEHKADLSIRFQGELRFVDVQVTCPATHAQVGRNAHLVPGTAADKAYRRKLFRYAQVLLGANHSPDNSVESVTGFQPFILETGGLIHPKSVKWLDQLLADHPKVLRKCYRVVMDTLDRHHGNMLCKFKASVL